VFTRLGTGISAARGVECVDCRCGDRSATYRRLDDDAPSNAPALGRLSSRRITNGETVGQYANATHPVAATLGDHDTLAFGTTLTINRRLR